MANVVNFASWNPNSQAQAQAQVAKPKATWWINFDLMPSIDGAPAIEAGLPMDALTKDGERAAKGSLRELYDWVMETFQGIPLNTMTAVEINGRKFKLWHGDGTPSQKLDKSSWTAKVLD
jgi:hypothetical protein